MARKLQNPLANIKALMTDNTIAFGAGERSRFELVELTQVEPAGRALTLRDIGQAGAVRRDCELHEHVVHHPVERE